FRAGERTADNAIVADQRRQYERPSGSPSRGSCQLPVGPLAAGVRDGSRLSLCERRFVPYPVTKMRRLARDLSMTMTSHVPSRTWARRKTTRGHSGMTPRKRHIISLLLQNEVGALTRVTSLFSTRGYNIESLNVAPTDDATVSRVTLVTTGTDA